MKVLVRCMALLSMVLVMGCGGGPPDTSNAGTPPPHGGTLVNLPSGDGYLEVVKGTGSGSGYAFYFLDSGAKPATPAPTDGYLMFGPKKKADLKVDGDHLVTPTGPDLFPSGEPDGELHATINGKDVVVPLGVR